MIAQKNSSRKIVKAPSDALWMQCKDHPLEILIPGHPPSINQLYATFHGRRIKSREGHKWEGFSLLFVRRAAMELYGTFRLEDLKGKPLRLDLTFYRPTWRAKSGIRRYVRPDLTNFFKAAEDGIMAALGLDDSAVIEFTAQKIECDKEVRMRARLTFLEDS